MDFQIKSLTLYELSLPYLFAFRPSPEKKNPPQVLWLKLEAADGKCSFGEICLNSKYSNETADSVKSFVTENQQEWQSKIHNLDDLIAWISQHKQKIDQNPSAFSCVEAAILDGLAQHHKLSVRSLLGIKKVQDVPQAALLERSRPEQFMLQLSVYEQNRLSRFKVELDGTFKSDNLKLSLLASTGYQHIQFDGRHIWSSVYDIAEYIKLLPINPYSIENPFNKIDYEMLLELSKAQSARVVLNESVLTTHDAKGFQLNSEKFIINLRIARLGGLLRTLNMMQHARKAGFDIMIGANMGESDLSLKMGQLAAHAAGNNLVCQEGAFGIYMLNTDMYKMSLSSHSTEHIDTAANNGGPQLQQYIKRIS